MTTTTDPVDGTQIAYRTAGPDDPGQDPAGTVVLLHGTALSQAVRQGDGFLQALRRRHRVVLVGERDVPQREDAEEAVRILEEHGTRTRLDVLPGRGHRDVPADRTEILARSARFHGRAAGAPGPETVP